MRHIRALVGFLFIAILFLASGCIVLNQQLNNLQVEKQTLEDQITQLEKNNTLLAKQIQGMSIYADSVPLLSFKWITANISIGLHGEAIPFMAYQALDNAVTLWESSFTWFHDYYNLTIPYHLTWQNGTGDVNLYWDTNEHLDMIFGHDAGIQIGLTAITASPVPTHALLTNGTFASVSISISSDEITTHSLGVSFIGDIFTHEIGHALYLGDINYFTENADEMSTKYAFLCPQISTLDLFGIWYRATHLLNSNYTVISIGTRVPQFTIAISFEQLFAGSNETVILMPSKIPFAYSEVPIAEC